MNQPNDPTQRIKQLTQELNHHNRLYYVEARPVISDQQYDLLLKELQQLESDHPDLALPDSPTQRVGGDPIDGFRTVPHAIPMLSIDNTYNRDDLNAWVERVEKNLTNNESDPDPDQPQNSLFSESDTSEYTCIAMPKIDGVAISLRYEKGILTQALTRGNGAQGDDITQNAKTIIPIPLSLTTSDQTPIPDILEVRGEVFMTFKNFAALNRQREEEDQPPFANPRNSTAGSLKQIDPKLVAKRNLHFYAHSAGLIEPNPFTSFHEFFTALNVFGIPPTPDTQSLSTTEDIWQYIQNFDRNRHDSPYPVDGVVITIDSFAQQQTLGQTSKAPRWRIAYKYAPDQATTQLLQVDWQVGKTGKLTPRATMIPTPLAGTTVQHATLHNAGEMARKDIQLNDTVIIEKAGEIIPQVVSVVTDERPPDAKPIIPPTQCPVCSGPVVVELEDGTAIEIDAKTTLTEEQKTTETARRCVNPECPAQFREKLIWFAARNQMDIDGLGEKLIDQLLEQKLVNHFADIFHLAADQFASLERMAEKSAQNVVQAIDNAKSRGLAKVLASLGIRHIGSSTARAIAQHYPDIDTLLKADTEELINIPDVGPIVAKSLHAWLNSDAGHHTIKALRDAGLDLSSHQYDQTAADSPFNGKTIVLTGTLEHFKRNDLKEKLQALGAKVSSSVSSKTDILIAGSDPGSKHDKALKLEIDIWNESQLLEHLSES